MRRLMKAEAAATCRFRFVSAYVGGQPASKTGVVAFVKHHLGLVGREAEEAVDRILGEEIRVTDGTPINGEVPEVESYGLNVIRRTEAGAAYVGTWQVRAMLKQAASRLGLFQATGKIGSKGDMSEAMLVVPWGPSAVAGPQEIVIVGPDKKPWTDHIYEKFMGSVNTPKGRASIVHDSEIAPAGSSIYVRIEWPCKRITVRDMAGVLGLCERVALGSVKALERGRLVVEDLEIEGSKMPDDEAA
jgi:hypothetical protein